ncbi:hypothetical protein DAPPUDRAFT_248477 [Daphnia pulex]|uniref:Uncharacterized protein n=1 Tax=Daphnia pulex TaxID=6669 RepID=E9GUQ4_DAPPU|nr:hypothetical protein DAPPUDRAFT_248477 [Daphnia pulex]|eukprot:EFX76900.1 hypothetical protein DAPPUDRAFT_248477 [Daphnia pulex]
MRLTKDPHSKSTERELPKSPFVLLITVLYTTALPSLTEIRTEELAPNSR